MFSFLFSNDKPKEEKVQIRKLTQVDQKIKQEKKDELFDPKLYIQKWKPQYEKLLKESADNKQRVLRVLWTEFEQTVELYPTLDGISLMPSKHDLQLWVHNRVDGKGILHSLIKIPDTYPDGIVLFGSPNPINHVKWSREDTLLDYVTKRIVPGSYGADLPNDHQPPLNPWPPCKRVGSSMLSFFSMTPKETFKQKARKKFRCVYTKQSFDQTILGFDISFRRDAMSGKLNNVESNLLCLSLKAFRRYNIREHKGHRFTNWLPIYFANQDPKKTLELAKKSISLICTGQLHAFKSDFVLEVFPLLLNHILMQFANESQVRRYNDWPRFLEGYCAVHRLLLLFLDAYPELVKMAANVVSNFKTQENFRSKDAVPNLGAFLALCGISQTPFEDIKDAFFNEALSRTVFWAFKAYPKLNPSYKLVENEEKLTDSQKLSMIFQSGIVGYRLKAIQIFAMENIFQPRGVSQVAIRNQYDRFFNVPTDTIQNAVKETLDYLFAPDFKSLYEAFKALQVTVKSDDEILRLWERAVKDSERSKYHNIQIDASDEFEKNKELDLSQFMKDGKFVDDEDMWQMLSYERFMIESIPPGILETRDNPWRRIYLQYHLQEVISKLNDFKNFGYLYDTCKVCCDEIICLDIKLEPVTNLKSGYYYLAKILVLLKGLVSLSIAKGDVSLTVNAISNICKGVNRNPSINTLVMRHLSITNEFIKEMIDRKLVSEQIIHLDLSGNNLTHGFALLSKHLAHHRIMPNLEVIDLSRCLLNDNHIPSLVDAILFKKKLKKIILKKNNFSQTNELFKNLSFLPNIEEIDFTGCATAKLGDEGLGRLIELSSTIKTLKLWKFSSVCTGIEVREAFKNNRSLESLDLGSCNITDGHLTNFFHGLLENTTLRRIDLSSNNITSALFSTFVEQFKRETPKSSWSFKELILNDCSMLQNGLEQQVEHFAEFFSYTPLLEHLSLSGTNLPDKFWAKLGEVLNSHENLKTLNLSNCSLTPNSLKNFFNSFKSNQSIEVLNLEHNKNIGAAGSHRIAEFIGNQQKGFKTLNLYNCELTAEGCCNILRKILENKSIQIECLDLGLNQMRNRGCLALLELLRQNSSIQELKIKRNFLNLKSLKKLGETLSEHPIKKISISGNFADEHSLKDFVHSLKGKVQVDVSSFIAFIEEDRIKRTVYFPKIPLRATKTELKLLLNNHGISQIDNMVFHYRRNPKILSAAQYAFVTFPDAPIARQVVQVCSSSRTCILHDQILRPVYAGNFQRKVQKRKA